jgi:hypothetical protein
MMKKGSPEVRTPLEIFDFLRSMICLTDWSSIQVRSAEDSHLLLSFL